MTADPRQRVLFVCIGNSCRSQMAEAFARLYGNDILIAASAGLGPASHVAHDTLRAMAEKNLDLHDHFPKSISQLGRVKFDVAVNLSGFDLPKNIAPRVLEWDIDDPVCMEYEEHCKVRDQIEQLVMNLVLDLRRRQQQPRFRGQGSGRLKL